MNESVTVEILQGRGQLEPWDGSGNRISVAYRFEITSEILETRGFARVAVRKHSTGTISNLTGASIPQGYYRLIAADGEALRVKNLGGIWTILAS